MSYAAESTPTRANRLDPYFDALDRGELMTTRCRSCGHMQFPPRTACAECAALESLEWVATRGRGRVWSFCTFHKQYLVDFEATPYVVAIVELDEGTRLVSNLVGVEPDDIHVGLPVQAVFGQGVDGGLVRFTPATDNRQEGTSHAGP
jgi:uncharacterized protein